MNQSERSLSGFSPCFKTPDLDEERWREGSRHRPSQIWDRGPSVHFALLPLFLSTTDTDTPVAKTHADTGRIYPSGKRKRKKSSSIPKKSPSPLSASFGLNAAAAQPAQTPLPVSLPPACKLMVIFC